MVSSGHGVVLTPQQLSSSALAVTCRGKHERMYRKFTTAVRTSQFMRDVPVPLRLLQVWL
ncbi:hypothetical protein [Cyanobium sp. T1G-Tous]|uniref:hypothetical protein n=1 Tax=Cyanobium sp. T1G-Tous TaxID=2823722 RepID=UPI0020CFC5C8|nr:hypothetical protein [Cyanobium sp. T1G-Tous]